jgi:hypothetical protein
MTGPTPFMLNSFHESNDARIVAEDDTHIVIAFRVDKAVVQRLLPFLAALADTTVTSPKRP